ncbi:hypothetical protein ZWY2020_049165 [Hordeum vulgare]|nr:hypothetical protein ZWY2020_049165 [Hordeum vulgare]
MASSRVGCAALLHKRVTHYSSLRHSHKLTALTKTEFKKVLDCNLRPAVTGPGATKQAVHALIFISMLSPVDARFVPNHKIWSLALKNQGGGSMNNALIKATQFGFESKDDY